MKQLFSSLVFVVLSLSLTAQVGVGEWTDYLSYTSAQQVIETDGQIYCITAGGLFSYNRADNSLHKLNQINGLSDVQPHVMAYSIEQNVVLLAYQNSNLDLIFEQEVVNLSDIKRKQIQGDKSVYNILMAGPTAYLSCGFGIVAVNLQKLEIKDTYYIGENGSPIVVMDMAFDGTYLYAATREGVFRANANSPNLQDFHEWNQLETIPHADEAFTQIEFFNGDLIACYSSADGSVQELYRDRGDGWQRFLPAVSSVNRLRACHNQLLISLGEQLHVYTADDELVGQLSRYSFSGGEAATLNIQDAICDEDGGLWVADAWTGLVHQQGDNSELTIPKGPVDNRAFSLLGNGTDLWVTTGGRTSAWNNIFNDAQGQLLRNGSWQLFNGWTHEELRGFHDLVTVAVDPRNADHVFFGSWGGGVVEFQGREFVNRFTQFNSSLQTALPGDANPNYVRIGGMAFDSKNNLWMTNSLVGKPLSVYRADGSWESFELEGIGGIDVGEIVLTENDDQWIVLPRGRDLYVRKADGSLGRRLQLVAYFNNGDREEFFRMNDVYSIAVDQDDAVWVGTSQGVAVYFDPEGIWEQNSFYASQPGLDLDDGIYHPLLRGQTVTAIAVDGANRKWLGTQNSGVFLVSEDGRTELKSFNKSNSLLLSNTIQSIAINDQTGEVFFATPEGLIAYRGEATKGGSEYADVYAFPNPVREDYDGDIVITGLITDTDIKITDISGNLVYQTTSLGGQAIWDGKNLNGNRVSTGVYVVFGNDKFGERTFTTKILFIH
ncbi:T9SS type A sorting domain-containing protein [uncultured Sunxiuqinia sp.]|uniref:type IX secretion system anionic LPS delivery protein PorZ n=1 Tax=uncultured Sunxiuqinia sp. TaxID=1573825 RepID=UPI002621709B|nr:T9SS type A sorting domain-containing protein [uncultured Sunxiuqinia sp.]